MNNYEILYVCDPTYSEEKLNVLTDRIQKNIEAVEGAIDNIDDWGIRRLAYPIKKVQEGHYILVDFHTTGEHVPVLEKQLRLLPGMMRFVIVRKDK